MKNIFNIFSTATLIAILLFPMTSQACFMALCKSMCKTKHKKTMSAQNHNPASPLKAHTEKNTNHTIIPTAESKEETLDSNKEAKRQEEERLRKEEHSRNTLIRFINNEPYEVHRNTREMWGEIISTSESERQAFDREKERGNSCIAGV